MTIVTSGLTSGRMVTTAIDGFMAGTSTTTAITGRMLGENVNSGFVRQHNDDRETSGWNDADECSNDRKEQMRSSHSLFEAKSMNQLISSLCRGNDVATFSGMEVDPGESLADTAAQSGIIDVRPFR